MCRAGRNQGNDIGRNYWPLLCRISSLVQGGTYGASNSAGLMQRPKEEIMNAAERGEKRLYAANYHQLNFRFITNASDY